MLPNTIKNVRDIRTNEKNTETKEINHDFKEENTSANNSSALETSTSILVSFEKKNIFIRKQIGRNIFIFFFFSPPPPPFLVAILNYKDDSSVTMTEDQDNDEASEPIAQHDVDGVAPYFIDEANLPIFIPRPSGNMVKVKCPAAGKTN